METLKKHLWNVGHASALLFGAFWLVATSAPERCGTFSAPVAFQVEGDCGPGGVIVVEADSFQGNLTITNPGALGLPPLSNYTGSSTSVYGRYYGTSCPYTFANGEWFVVIGGCAAGADGGPPDAARPPDAADAGDAGDAAGPEDAGRPDTDAAAATDGAAADAGGVSTGGSTCAASPLVCRAALESGVLWYTCGQGGDGGAPLCRSRLTVLQ